MDGIKHKFRGNILWRISSMILERIIWEDVKHLEEQFVGDSKHEIERNNLERFQA